MSETRPLDPVQWFIDDMTDAMKVGCKIIKKFKEAGLDSDYEAVMNIRAAAMEGLRCFNIYMDLKHKFLVNRSEKAASIIEGLDKETDDAAEATAE